MGIDSGWHTVADAAAALGVSDRTVRRRVKAGKLEHKRESNRLFVKLADTDTAGVDTASQDVGQTADAAALRAEVDTLSERLASGRQLAAQRLGDMQAEVDRLTAERNELHTENAVLKARTEHLQSENARLWETVKLLPAPAPRRHWWQFWKSE